ncbi:metallothionein-2 [Drosophila mojavensis]|uniref:Metallothionein B n=2 Tax=mojavensis species complex TaxID=198037 RepID=B4K7S1_DROMO|nr:metallothionein-2 [Drosophila mojavensis]XP_017865597.1 PREDICTED: metallothionein-2-like [Drosophila arizonae]EDW16442.1 metallothionein B [Drosophila mojavensis]
MGCKNCVSACQCSTVKCGGSCACIKDCSCVCKSGPKEQCCSSK